MNARVYDNVIGRFLSADTIIQAPDDSQSYNRYSYVRNNPLMYTDPSGHSWLSSAWHSVSSAVSNNFRTIAAVAIGAVIAVYAPGLLGAYINSAFGVTVATGALAGFASGAIMTGTVKGALTGAVFGAIGAGVAFGVAEATSSMFGINSVEAHEATLFKAGMQKIAVAKSMMHGLTCGLISMAQGGTFKSGFASGFTSSAFSVGTKGHGGFVGRTAIMSIVGGTASKLGGGKFSNGAVSGAFVHMFNAEGLINKFSVTDLITAIGGGLQVITGGIMIATGVGAPLGVALVTLGVNNFVSAETGTNYIQNGLSSLTNGAVGAKTYAALDILASGVSAVPQAVARVGIKSFGTASNAITYHVPISAYQTSSGQAAIGTELVGAANNIHGAVQ